MADEFTPAAGMFWPSADESEQAQRSAAQTERAGQTHAGEARPSGVAPQGVPLHPQQPQQRAQQSGSFQPAPQQAQAPQARPAQAPVAQPGTPVARPQTGQVPQATAQAPTQYAPTQQSQFGQGQPQPQQARPSTQSAPVSGQVPQRTSFGMGAGAGAATSAGAPTSAPASGSAGPDAPQGASNPQQGGIAGARRVGMSQEQHDGDLDIGEALRGMLRMGASDLHVTSGAPPMIRVDGGLAPLEGFSKLTPDNLQRSLYQILTQSQREQFEENLELDFSYALVGEARFRVNLYRQRQSVGAAFRVIPYEIKPLESLGIPRTVAEFAQLPRGLVLVTGPTGSGKSTTLASLVDLANRSRSSHIMTVEDPIEFLHRHKRSLVNQREIGADTQSFQKALKHVLRQDPDIILIGEMRDLETIQVALTAAETGHLVFATLHTQDAAQTIDRVIDVFPAEQQGQIRTQLATAIQGVVCQSLLPRADGPGRAVAVELLVATPGIRNLIREGKTHQIYTSLQSGAAQGMQSMDQHLAELVKAGTVSFDVAVELCHSYEEFSRLCGRAGEQRY
ncbi:PilT/PilU family type 4a pilus ATPase [Demequina sediminicola]|uniref:PilT/PilU family type 4a pilus ATPase n=1 Tax=Demequina sediminicola TaxID=1095026 RepID=UPI000A59451F|nr:PilT/PilU family type 4a pilus ATPase [Demequina sediminicola]